MGTSNAWSCARYNWDNAWYFNNVGNFNNNNFYNSLNAVPVTNLSKKDMVKIEDIISVYYSMRRNKRRKNDSVEFEIRFERNILQLMHSIDNLTLRADANYAFVTFYPKIREIFGAKMSVRLIHAYIDWRLRPILENELINTTFNNRVGKGTQAAINNVITDIYYVSKGFTHNAWIIKWDLSGYFPNAIVDVAFNQIKMLIEKNYHGEDKEDLIWMCMICLYSFPQGHCYRKSSKEKWNFVQPRKSLFNKNFGEGAAIGFLIWQNAMNYYINDIDHWIVDDCGLRLTRFVDDNVVITDNKDCVLQLFPKLREKYNRIGVKMNEKKFYCQHYTKGLEFLGSHIKLDRVYINNKSIDNFVKKVQKYNNISQSCKYYKVGEFISSANSTLGMMKNRDEFNNIRRCIGLIDNSWGNFIHFNTDKIAIESNSGFSNKDIIIKKYNLKLRHYDKTGKRSRINAA